MPHIRYLRVSVTTDCNETCWYCYNEGHPHNQAYMSDVDDFEWLITKIISHYGVDVVHFTGGEPLLNPNIVRLIDVVKNASVKNIGLTTNGILLPDYYEKISAVTPVQYSVHIYRIDTRACEFEEVKQIISSTISYAKNVRFNIVVTKDNIEIVR